MIALILAPSKGKAPYPPLAICALKAWLKKYGYSSTAIDLNRYYVINHQELLFNINKHFGLPSTHLDSGSEESIYNLGTIYNFELLLKFMYNVEYEDNTLTEDELVFYKCLNSQLEIEAHRLLDAGYNCIGFSTFVSNVCFSLLLGQKIKQIDPKVKVFYGGSSTAYEPIRDFMIQSRIADYVIVGEGENGVLRLIGDIERNKANYSTIYSENIAPKLLGENEIVAPIVKNLDELPFPDFSDLDMDSYTLEYNRKYRFASLATSRGCVNRCAYCSETQYWRRFRQRSVSRVIEEIEYLYNTYRCRIFFFCDSLINGNVLWLKDFCTHLIDKKLNIQWLSYVTLNNVNSDLLQLMYDSGCVALTFGIEHVNTNVLDSVNKKSSIGNAKSRLLECINSGIFPIANIIYSLPQETPEAFMELLAFTCDPEINSKVLFTFRSYEIRVGSETTSKLMETTDAFPNHQINMPHSVMTFKETILKLATYWNPDKQYIKTCKDKHAIITSFYGKNNESYLKSISNARKYNIPSILRRTIKLDSVPTIKACCYKFNTKFQLFILSQIDGVHTVADIIEAAKKVVFDKMNNCNINIVHQKITKMVFDNIIELSLKHKLSWN